MDRKIIIERIVSRYKALNQSDYENGMIDYENLLFTNKCAVAFGNYLNRLSDSELFSFYNLNRNVQIKVFCWHSACESIENQTWLKQAVDLTKEDMIKTGYNMIPVVNTLMGYILEAADKYINAFFADLGNGVVFYDFKK